MTQTKLVTPIVNLNGNTAESLIAQLKDVLNALHQLEQAMAKSSDIWHGRNFQTMKDGDVVSQKARRAWNERQRMVGELHNEVLTMAAVILDQKHGTYPLTSPKGWDSVEGGPMPVEEGNDTQPLGVVLNETHAEGDELPLGPRTGDK
jgi:hypothetical protein